jgi:hypothetical protein
MDKQFEHRRIGRDFHRELAELVASGNSAVLLSLRDLGKRYVLRRLSDTLRQEGAVLLVEVEFPLEPAILIVTQVQGLLQAAASRAAPDFIFNPAATPDELLDALKQLCDRQPRRVVLLASNVDSLAHHLAQSFLREARVLVSRPQNPLTGVLTGEENLQDLVYGPESEFNCAYQFALQGFDEPEFLDYMHRRREVADIPFDDETACLRLLFQRTNGNIYLGRAALWGWLEMEARTLKCKGIPVTETAFGDFLAKFPGSDASGMDVYFHTGRVIASAPLAWKDLESLRHGRAVLVAHQSAPHALEFAALAIRSGGQLHYASPIMEQFAHRYYDDCRLGDLYAVHGEWFDAFRFYTQMPASQRLRPGGAADVPRLALVIKAFIAKMHTLATRTGIESEQKLNELKDFFAQGCQFILGVSDVTFWRFAVQWEPHPGQTIESVVRNLAIDILEIANRQRVGWQEIPSSLGKRGALAVLPSVRPDWRDAVVVSDARRTVAISKERGEFLRELLDQFANAYDHTIANWGVKLRLDAIHNHLAIATKIVNALGETVRNPGEVLKIAGDELLKLGYRRIMFAMVDPKRERIQGVHFCCGTPPKKDVAKGTDWALDDWQSDIQPWVVHHKKSCCVINWRNWNERRNPELPPINKTLCEEAETALNFAVVPMMLSVTSGDGKSVEKVFGTIHVERGDALPPSADDLDDLLEFARQIAATANQAERVHAFREALLQDEDGLVIFDAEEPEPRVCFINTTAIKRLRLDIAKVRPGWLDVPNRIKLRGTNGERVAENVRKAITSGKRNAHYDTSQGEAVVCTPIGDWRMDQPKNQAQEDCPSRAIGAVLQIHDLTGLLGVFAALRSIAKSASDSENMTEALLKCITNLGFLPPAEFVGARIYRISDQDPELLVSDRAVGLPEPFARKFAEGGYRIKKADPFGKEAWWCMANEAPRVCLWNPSDANEGPVTTDTGLTVINIKQPAFNDTWKRPGDIWMDLPLLAGEKAIGKLTIDVGRNGSCPLTPEEFELLKLFSVLLGPLLAAFDKGEWVRRAAERAMAEAAHKIGTKLAGLSGFVEDYRRAAPGNAKVEEINGWMEPIVRACFDLVNRVREDLTGNMRLQRSRTPVLPLLEATLEGMLGGDRRAERVSWQIECSADITCHLDEERFRNALEAMFDNSRAMTPPGRKLEMLLRAEGFRREEGAWLRLTVRDHGPGIPPDQRERIFEPFYSRRPDGKRSTGLGLSFVRRVIAAHGGTVVAVAPDGPGAEFVIEIPDIP